MAEKGTIWVRFSLAMTLLGTFAFGIWMLVQAMAGTAASNGPAKLAGTPMPTSLAPTPWTTPLVSDYVLEQENRVRLEATKAAVQASIDLMDEEIRQADESRKFALLRRQQELELDRDEITNRLLELAAQEEGARVPAEAQRLANNVELDARATQIAQDAQVIIQEGNAQATVRAQDIALDLAEAEAKEAEADAILYYSLVVFLVVLGVIGLGIVVALAYIAIYPNLRRVKLEERGRAQLGLSREEEVALLTENFFKEARRRAVIVPSHGSTGEVVEETPSVPIRQRGNAAPTPDGNYGNYGGIPVIPPSPEGNSSSNYGNSPVIPVTPPAITGNAGNSDSNSDERERIVSALGHYLTAEQLAQLPLNSTAAPAWAVRVIRKMASERVRRNNIAVLFGYTGRNYDNLRIVLDGNEEEPSA